DTHLTLKELAPVRLLKNKFYYDVQEAYSKGATQEQLLKLLGHARAKKGMFDGDLEEGELEIGQVSALIHEILPASEIVANLMSEFQTAKRNVSIL
ncbi:MAG: nitronate monooxygenase, partial [Pricia sp.]|nr:nitronate monooxygenase [Pricia sp.]